MKRPHGSSVPMCSGGGMDAIARQTDAGRADPGRPLRWCVAALFLLAVVGAMLLFVPLPAAGNPHEVSMTDVDGCAGCHRFHTARGAGFITATSSNLLCLTCHDGSGAVSRVSTHSNALDESPPRHFTRQEQAFSIECVTCHDPHNGQSNLHMVRETINSASVSFTATTGPDSYDENGADIDDADDICVTCHVNATDNAGYPMAVHPGGDHTGTGFSGEQRGRDCTYCHPHDPDSDPSTGDGFMTCSTGGAGCHDLPPNGSMSPNKAASHQSHIADPNGPGLADCSHCHSPVAVADGHDGGELTFSDGQPLASTALCDACHSPDGVYNGVTSMGDSVGAKDSWAAGVYDANHALKAGNEKWCAGCHDVPVGGKIDIVGSGFYSTGHGKAGTPTDECVACHDVSSTDYLLKAAFASTYFWNGSASSELALCFSCHSYDTYYDGDGTSGFDKHKKHVQDEKTSCYACHAVSHTKGETGVTVLESNMIKIGGAITGYTGDFNGSGGCFAPDLPSGDCHSGDLEDY